MPNIQFIVSAAWPNKLLQRIKKLRFFRPLSKALCACSLPVLLTKQWYDNIIPVPCIESMPDFLSPANA